MPYFNIFQEYLFLSSDIPIEEKKKLDEYLNTLEESGVGKIVEKCLERDYSKGGRPLKEPYRLFASIIYAFSKHKGSLRRIEESLTFDLRFIYLMNQVTTSYVSISKLLNSVTVKNHHIILSKIVQTIIKKYEINIDDCFLDGTKIEANANKYKFVYKPTKHKESLILKIKELLTIYFPISENKFSFTSKEIGSYLNQIIEIAEKQNIDLKNIKSGKGYKVPLIFKDYKTLSGYLLKMLDYEEKERICGDNRNSFYKTDKDATMMCLKEDYYSGLGSNMHAAYNIQIIVSKGLILDYFISQDRNDYNTMIPFLDSFYSSYGFYPKRLYADSGYGSLENYRYLDSNGIENYVKFGDWEKVKNGEHAILYHFDDDGNLVCLNGKIARKEKEYNGRHSHKKGFLYIIDNCKRCKYKSYCQKTLKRKTNERIFEANEKLFHYKNIALNNLLSTKGIEMRVNRSAQVEGVYGVIKEDMDFDRFRRRGLDGVDKEFLFVCLGYNIKKLFSLIEGKGKIDYWKAPEDLKEEKIPEINLEKLGKHREKGKNETLRNQYKRKRLSRNI